MGPLIAPSLLATIIIVFLFQLMAQVSGWELLIIPLALIIMSSWEYGIHKYWMHKLFKPLWFLFKHHRTHHQRYTSSRMEINSVIELYFILSPVGGIMVVFATIVPLWFLISLFDVNAACLFIITTLLYFITYEFTHLSYHLPKTFWVRSKRIINFLSKHHTRHHDSRNLFKFNFNVTFPLFDWISRTKK